MVSPIGQSRAKGVARTEPGLEYIHGAGRVLQALSRAENEATVTFLDKQFADGIQNLFVIYSRSLPLCGLGL